MIAYIVDALVLVGAVTFAVIYTKSYLATPADKPWYNRLWDAIKVSLTVTWAAAVVAGTTILDLTGYLADYLNAGAGDQLKAAIDPRYAAALIIGIILISVVARLRTLFK